MGVYIKGMEMPTNCFYCPLSVLSGERLFCEVTKDEVVRAKRSSDCPLVPVPPHGSLGDLDALAIVMAEGLCPTEKNKGFEHPFDILRAIDAAPTVIPAEEDTNGE